MLKKPNSNSGNDVCDDDDDNDDVNVDICGVDGVESVSTGFSVVKFDWHCIGTEQFDVTTSAFDGLSLS